MSQNIWFHICFGTFGPFCLETNSPFIQWTKYLLCFLFAPQWVHIYPLEWIIWLHFMTLHCFDEMVVRNQRFGTFSPIHLEINFPLIQWTKYLLCILLTPQWVHIYPLEWIIWLHFMVLHFLRWWWCKTSVLGHSVHFVLKPIQLSSNGQNIFCASYLHPNGSIFIHWNGLSDCISCFYIFWGDGGAKPAFWDIRSISS